jgi:hypothetical protein
MLADAQNMLASSSGLIWMYVLTLDICFRAMCLRYRHSSRKSMIVKIQSCKLALDTNSERIVVEVLAQLVCQQ